MIFSSFLRQRHNRQIDFSQIAAYLNTNQAFTVFCENAVIKKYSQENVNTISRTYRKVGSNIKKAVEKGKIDAIKMIIPLKRLCIRLFESQQGITSIHIAFLELCLAKSFPKQAIQIIKSKALPRSIFKWQYSQFCRLAGSIYLQLEQYENAFSMLRKSIIEDPIDLQKTVGTIKKYIMLSIIVGQPITFEHLNNIFEHFRIGSVSFEILERDEDDSEVNSKASYKFDPEQMVPYKLMLDSIQLDSNSLFKIQADGNVELFSKILTKSQSFLRDTLKKNIISGKASQRMSQVKQISMSDWQNIRKVNCIKGKRLYKYDCKQRTANFIQFHNKVDSNTINTKVTECVEKYQQIVNNAQIIRQSVQSLRGAPTGGFSTLMGRFISK